ncbi:MAG TPA: adenylate cyclase [Actinomycetaceae bacterium]|nr:adenylate cyclase [Actinomycetaceae bacterium]
MDEGNFEFERKFFVPELPAVVATEPHPAAILQSYVLAVDGYAIRVRLQASQLPTELRAAAHTGDQGERELLEAWAPHYDLCMLTAKGPYVGGTRYEVEREVDVNAGLGMVRRGGQLVAKLRHSVWLDEDGWVIDEFLGGNAGLIVAEVERGGPVVDLTIPAFCATEITDDTRFANDELAHTPFGEWREEFAADLARRGPRFLTDFGRNTVAP